MPLRALAAALFPHLLATQLTQAHLYRTHHELLARGWYRRVVRVPAPNRHTYQTLYHPPPAPPFPALYPYPAPANDP